MSVFDPKAPPFYELQRGGGPVMDTMMAHEEVAKAAAEQKRRLDNPLVALGGRRRPGAKSPGAGLTYRERRELGLCTDCGWVAAGGLARCEKCRANYNPRHAQRVAEGRLKNKQR